MHRYRQSAVVVGKNGKAEVWNWATGDRTTCFKIDEMIRFVQISDNLMISTRRKVKFIYIHNDGGNYGLVASADLKLYFRRQGKSSEDPHIHDITVINSNLMMVVCWLGIEFVPLLSGKIVACFECRSVKFTHCATVLRDGRIYATGKKAYFTTFEVPDNIGAETTCGRYI